MTVLGRQDVGDMGWAAYFKDVEGNLMGLWQRASPEQPIRPASIEVISFRSRGSSSVSPSGTAWSSIIARNSSACSTIRGSMCPNTSSVTVP